MADTAAIESVRGQAAEIARGWSKPGAPASWALTAAVFGTLAGDDDLVAMAAEIPGDRLPALLFTAAAGYLIADHEPTGLVEYFPNGSALAAGTSPPQPDPSFASAWRTFCLAHRDELLDVCDRRRYQMNEVARSTQVALALGVVGKRCGADRVALIDLGTGAGLGLYPDRYGHRLTGQPAFGDPSSPLGLTCEVTGPARPPVPASLPDVEQRIGIDLDPIDLADADDRRWARACIPPEQDSLDRFDAAARIVTAAEATIMRGDAAEALPDLLDSVPGDLLPVVVDTYTAVFFPDERRQRLHDVLHRFGARRYVAWISLDPMIPLGAAGRDSVQDLDVPADLVAEYQREGVFALLGLVTYQRGHRRADLLARAHPSGTQMTWLGETDG